MIIKKACATFGNLDNRTLEFNPGLNIFTMDNEAGKSTWCAFIRVMLFGIDTRERDKAPTKDNPIGRLADKNRYAPWNGKPLSGRLIIEHDGREIEIIRSNSRAGAMQNFSARFTDTLEPVPGLTSKNCGEFLCGVCSEAYEKSALIQSGQVICAGASAELENKISSLVTSGSDDSAASLIGQRLNKIKTAIFHNSATGALPRINRELYNTGEKIKTLQNAALSEASLHSDIAASREKLCEISNKLDLLQHYADWENSSKLSNYSDMLAQSRASLESARQAASENGKPITEQFLNDARNKLALVHSAEKAQSEKKDNFERAEKAFSEHAATISELNAEPPKSLNASKLPFIFAVLFAFSSIISLFFSTQFSLFSACSAIIFAAIFLYNSKKASLLNKRLFADYNSKQEQYQKTSDMLKKYECQKNDCYNQLADARKAYASALCDMLEFICPLHPGISDSQQAEDFLNSAQIKISQLTKAEYEYNSILEKYEQLKAAIKPEPIQKPQAPRPDQSSDELNSEKERLTELIHSLERQCAAISGEISAIGDLAVLSAQYDKLSNDSALLQKRYNSVLLAINTLNQVSSELSAKVSAPISKLAAQYLSALTGGKYNKFELYDNFRAMCAQFDSEGCIPAEKLSSGCADALYLALRLAVCELVLSEKNPPIILDDALLTFDHSRTAFALDLLDKISRKRQVILFSCRDFSRNSLSD